MGTAHAGTARGNYRVRKDRSVVFTYSELHLGEALSHAVYCFEKGARMNRATWQREARKLGERGVFSQANIAAIFGVSATRIRQLGITTLDGAKMLRGRFSPKSLRFLAMSMREKLTKGKHNPAWVLEAEIRGTSQAVIARLLGLSTSTISRLIREGNLIHERNALRHLEDNAAVEGRTEESVGAEHAALDAAGVHTGSAPRAGAPVARPTAGHSGHVYRGPGDRHPVAAADPQPRRRADHADVSVPPGLAAGDGTVVASPDG